MLMKGCPATFSQPSFGQGGVVFFNFTGKIVFGDPPLPQTPTPLERESLPPKTPQMRGISGSLFKCDFLVLGSTVLGASFSRFFKVFLEFFRVFSMFLTVFSMFFKVFKPQF